MLSDENKDQDALDANVINNLIYLEGHLKKEVNIVVELLDPNNYEIVKDFNISNTIISNKIISLLLSKVALYQETESFYENLLTLEINDDEEDDQEVFIRDANELLEENFPVSFHNVKSLIVSIYESFDRKFIPMGIIRDNEFSIFSEDLHKEKETLLFENDALVLMKLGEEHDD